MVAAVETSIFTGSALSVPCQKVESSSHSPGPAQIAMTGYTYKLGSGFAEIAVR